MIASALLCLHLLAVVVWIGGMAVLHWAVRPVAVKVLAPPDRLPLLTAMLGRFFVMVAVAVVVLLGSGFGLIRLSGGFAQLHWAVHAMTAIGLLMMALFARVLFSLYPKLRDDVEEKRWPDGARRLDGIRRIVTINLSLGVLIIVLITCGRAASLA